jgi:circadian clock protein KaiC
MDGCLEKVMAVAKMRGFPHSKELRRYDISNEGIIIGEALTGYEGILIGAPRKST